MPTFYVINSIKIDVYSRDHLPPHFHALYAEHEVLIVIKTLKLMQDRYQSGNKKWYLNGQKAKKLKLYN